MGAMNECVKCGERMETGRKVTVRDVETLMCNSCVSEDGFWDHTCDHCGDRRGGIMPLTVEHPIDPDTIKICRECFKDFAGTGV